MPAGVGGAPLTDLFLVSRRQAHKPDRTGTVHATYRHQHSTGQRSTAQQQHSTAQPQHSTTLCHARPDSLQASQPRPPLSSLSPVWPLLADQVHPLFEARLNRKALQQGQGKVVAATDTTAPPAVADSRTMSHTHTSRAARHGCHLRQGAVHTKAAKNTLLGRNTSQGPVNCAHAHSRPPRSFTTCCTSSGGYGSGATLTSLPRCGPISAPAQQPGVARQTRLGTSAVRSASSPRWGIAGWGRP